GGSGGAGGSATDAARVPTDATTARDGEAPPVDGAPVAADAGPLGAFPLAAVKMASAQPWAALNAHPEGPSWRADEVFFAADGFGLMRVAADRKLYRYHPKLSPVGSYLLADG